MLINIVFLETYIIIIILLISTPKFSILFSRKEIGN